MVGSSARRNLKGSVRSVVSTIEDYSIHTSSKWRSRKNELDVDGKGKKYAQWCQVRTRILGRGSGDYMLPG